MLGFKNRDLKAYHHSYQFHSKTTANRDIGFRSTASQLAQHVWNSRHTMSDDIRIQGNEIQHLHMDKYRDTEKEGIAGLSHVNETYPDCHNRFRLIVVLYIFFSMPTVYVYDNQHFNMNQTVSPIVPFTSRKNCDNSEGVVYSAPFLLYPLSAWHFSSELVSNSTLRANSFLSE